MRITSDPSLKPLLAVLALLMAGCATKSSRNFRLVPLPGPTYSVDAEVASITTKSLRVSISPVDDAARGAYIRSHAAAGADPFGPGADGRPRYVAFRLIVENRGASDPIVFEPQRIILAQETGERISPFDFPEAYRLLAGRENSDPRLLEDLSKYMFDIGVTVAPGERIDRLLIYPAGKVRSKRLRMELSFLEPLSSSDKYDVIFRREPIS